MEIFLEWINRRNPGFYLKKHIFEMGVVNMLAFPLFDQFMSRSWFIDNIGFGRRSQRVTLSRRVWNPYHRLTQALWVKLDKRNSLVAIDGYASMKLQVIMAEGVSVR